MINKKKMILVGHILRVKLDLENKNPRVNAIGILCKMMLTPIIPICEVSLKIPTESPSIKLCKKRAIPKITNSCQMWGSELLSWNSFKSSAFSFIFIWSVWIVTWLALVLAPLTSTSGNTTSDLLSPPSCWIAFLFVNASSSSIVSYLRSLWVLFDWNIMLTISIKKNPAWNITKASGKACPPSSECSSPSVILIPKFYFLIISLIWFASSSSASIVWCISFASGRICKIDMDMSRPAEKQADTANNIFLLLIGFSSIALSFLQHLLYGIKTNSPLITMIMMIAILAVRIALFYSNSSSPWACPWSWSWSLIIAFLTPFGVNKIKLK